jgi:hypothetical protein
MPQSTPRLRRRLSLLAENGAILLQLIHPQPNDLRLPLTG